MITNYRPMITNYRSMITNYRLMITKFCWTALEVSAMPNRAIVWLEDNRQLLHFGYGESLDFGSGNEKSKERTSHL